MRPTLTSQRELEIRKSALASIKEAGYVKLSKEEWGMILNALDERFELTLRRPK